MDFKTSQKLYSVPRMRKYLNACAGDKRKTMQLYRYNLRLCQRFYGALNLLEVMLRNDINEHYIAYYSDPNWIVNQADSGKLLEYNKDEIRQTEAGYRRRGIYNNDKMVASLTMGFWTKLFSRKDTSEVARLSYKSSQTSEKARIRLMSTKTSLIFANSVTALPIMNQYASTVLVTSVQPLHADTIN